MEASKDKLVVLVNTVQDDTEEKDQAHLDELGEEVEYNRSNVVSMAQMVKGTADEGRSKRAQKALNESMEAARIGQQRPDGLRTRLEFYSGDSEAGSYVGGATRGGREGAKGATWEQPLVMGGGRDQPGGGSFYFRSGQDGEPSLRREVGPCRSGRGNLDHWTSLASCGDGAR
jgi:hypothetical protein